LHNGKQLSLAIGTIEKDDERRSVVLDPRYRAGLEGLDDFSHVIVIWWAERFEAHRFGVDMVIDLPYAPGVRAGLFTTRAPVRPNPICVNTARILGISVEEGRIELDEIDAYAGTQVLDIKPYYGCIDRVKDYRQPDWVPSDWGEWYVPIPEIDYGAGE
jgi:tRNA (Thr-GGU) A37 N-methylase